MPWPAICDAVTVRPPNRAGRIGPDALETLKQYKLRGETVAMLVADYRMPQITGIEFLEAAMDL